VFTESSVGTVQGSTLSPLLGNVYLHHVLDLWFTEEVKPRLRGKAVLVRYADDGCFGFERQDDAQRVMAVLSQRLATFDFLGFCWYWRRSRRGNWSVACKTRRARLMRAPAEEPDGGNLQVRFRRGPGLGDRPRLLNGTRCLT